MVEGNKRPGPASQARLRALTPTVTLYDLANTCMAGNASLNPKAQKGRSNEKRCDRPLPTLGQPQPASKQTHPGVYKLRTTLTDWNDGNLWRTYTMPTDLEAVFQSLESEPGMRPAYHHKEDRCDGHPFITVLAYQAVQVIRSKLGGHGIRESWASLREKTSPQTIGYRRLTDRLLKMGYGMPSFQAAGFRRGFIGLGSCARAPLAAWKDGFPCLRALRLFA